MKKIKVLLIAIFIFSFMGCSVSKSKTNDTVEVPQPAEINIPTSQLDYEIPVFCQFYDWFEEVTWVEDEFVDPILWEEVGITNDDRSSVEFYEKQFSYMKELGIDAISWEYHTNLGKDPLYPSENAIQALKNTGMKIAPFFDYEISIKAETQSPEEVIAVLSEEGYIQPNDETVDFIVNCLDDFYAHVPNELLAEDAKGRKVIFVFGYDFNDSEPDVQKYQSFGENLIKRVCMLYGDDSSGPAFYWSCKNSVFLEYLYQHFSDNFIPFQFVLDTPQSQYSHDSVTWNFGFDNLGVFKRDNLQRVIRLDQRYIQEMGWLAGATRPSLVYIYSWNEPFEGSMLIPTNDWGDTKARLAKHMIEQLNEENEVLEKTLLITDDLSDSYGKDIWQYKIEEEMLLYSMRRFLPQADVLMAKNVTADILNQYDNIVDISTDKPQKLVDLLTDCFDSKQIMVFDPKCGYTTNNLAKHFGIVGQQMNLNTEIRILGEDIQEETFVRDDLNDINLFPESDCENFYLNINDKNYPVVVTNGDDIFVNSYNNEEIILKEAFERFYGFEMNISIMYGEGLASQRLEIEPYTNKVTMNTLSKVSVNGHWEIPSDINWFIMPKEVDESYYDFIFGI